MADFPCQVTGQVTPWGMWNNPGHNPKDDQKRRLILTRLALGLHPPFAQSCRQAAAPG